MREAEIDRELASCLRRIADPDRVERIVRRHPYAALGGSAMTGFVAMRLLLRGGGGISAKALVGPMRALLQASMLAGSLRGPRTDDAAAEELPAADATGPLPDDA